MQHSIHDGLIDWFSGQSFSIEKETNLEPYRLPVKMKAGVSSLVIPSQIQSIVWAVDRGLGNGVERGNESGLACGEYVSFYMYPGNNSFASPAYISYTSYSTFLSQFEILYTHFPEYLSIPQSSGTMKIDSPDFKAPKGIWDRVDFFVINFDGSTFKVAPKIFSEQSMKEREYFPSRSRSLNNSVYAPFKNCPNIEKIEYQGDFENIVAIGACDFTYKDENGFDKLDAYPQGGSPLFINNYVNAKKIKFSEKFPKFNGSKLQISDYHFNAEEIVIDSTAAPELPFGGVSFKNAEMQRLQLPVMNFKIDLPLQTPEELNFVFGWGNLGVDAPNSVKHCHNLHTIYQNSTTQRAELNIATPRALKENILFSWGQALEQMLPELDLTDDLMPKVPNGLIRVEGYYRKVLIGHINEVFEGGKFGSFRGRMMLDGELKNYQIQRLPATVENVYGYGMNLYSDQEVSTDIFVPSIPSGVIYMRDCYRRMFYNTVGPETNISSQDSATSTMLVWSLSDASSVQHINLDFNLDATESGKFWEQWAKASSIRVMRKYGSYVSSIPTSEGRVETVWDTQLGDSVSYQQFWNLMNEIDSPHALAMKIRSNIVLEKQNFTNLQYCGDWQKECFFAAAVDPSEIDCLLPLPQGKEWNAYQGALNITTGIFFRKSNYGYFGTLTVRDENIDVGGVDLSKKYDLDFILLRANENFDESDFDEYRININDIIMSGSARTESSTVINPYLNATSEKTIQGDRAGFLQNYGIVLNNPESFSTGAAQSILENNFAGTPIGFNGYFVDRGSDYNPPEGRHVFVSMGSYSKLSADSGRFDTGIGDLNDPQYYYTAFWLDSTQLHRIPDSYETQFLTRQQLADLQATLNYISREQ